MRRPIGYVAADVGGMAPAELADALARAGYDAVDWTMEQFDPLADEGAALARLVAVAREAGLAVPQLMVHQDYVTPDRGIWEQRVRRTELAIDAAAAAGVPSVGVVSGPNRWSEGWARVGTDIAESDAWALATGALERALDRAAATPVRVALEPCWGTLAWNRETTERLLARVGAAGLAVNLDPSHFVMAGDDAAALVRAWSERLAHVHLKDAFGRPGAEGEDFCFLLPGEGATDWRAFLDALDGVGYAGAMSVEFESPRLRAQALHGSVEAGARLARELVAGLLGGDAG